MHKALLLLCLHCLSFAGRLTVITGPMYSGKSLKLIHLLLSDVYKDKRVLVCKYNINTCSYTQLSSRGSSCKITAIPLMTVEQLENIYNSYDIIIIDEIQFFSDTMADLLLKLRNRNKEIVVAGLDKDFRGNPFGCIRTLIEKADGVTYLKARCSLCNSEAEYSQRLIDGSLAGYNDDLVVLENSSEKVKYEPRCSRCFIKPH